jgi:hypothetical protein
MRTLLAAALLLAAACDYDPRGRCDADPDCPAGQGCAGGVCIVPGAAPTNHAPVAAADAHTATAGVPYECLAPCLLVNDVDADGDPLEAELAAGASHGAVFVSPDGSFRYLSDAGYDGADAFTYRASDGALRSAPVTVTITVTPAP